MNQKPIWLTAIRWSARIFSLLFIAFFLFIFIGESLSESENAIEISTFDYVILGTWAIAMLATLAAFKWEAIGGTINVVIMLTHFLMIAFRGKIALPILSFALPGLLYLISWYFHKKLNFK
ncbi:MAG: hypothetical protein WCH34_18235 [Bacteroidota bacterium]